MSEATTPPIFPRSVIVIGAGVFGLSTALAISKRHPSTKITVIDRLTPPVEDATSVDTTRCIRSDYTDPLYARLAAQAQKLIEADADLRPYYFKQGMTYVCDAEPSRFTEGWRKMFESAKRDYDPSVIIEMPSREAVFQSIHGSDAEPRPLAEVGGKSRWNTAYCNRGAAFVDARECIRAYYHRASAAPQIAFRLGTPVDRLQVIGGCCTGVIMQDGTVITADQVIVAAGAWSNKLVDLGLRQTPIGHEVVWFEVTPEEEARWKNMSITTNESTGLNIFPPYRGQVKVLRRSPGYQNTISVSYPENPSREVKISYPRTTVDHPGDIIPADAEAAVRRDLREIMPSLAERPFKKTKICWISATPTADFLVAPHPHVPGIHLATGGSAHAWKFLPILGDCVVDSIQGTLPEELAKRWAYDRFSGGKDEAAPRMDGCPEELRDVKCQPCEQAGAECLAHDSTAVRQVPRSYVRDLEERVAQLEQQLAGHGVNADVLLPTPAIAPSSSEALSPADAQITGKSTARVAAKSVMQLSDLASQPEPDYSQVFLASIMNEMAHPELHRRSQPAPPAEEEHAPLSDFMGDMQDAFPVTIPSKPVVEYLTMVYSRLTDIGLPLLHESILREKLDVLRDLPPTIDLNRTHTTTESRMATFFVLEVLAMALVAMQAQQPSARWLADQYHKTALKALSKTGLASSVEGVQALLLLGQYAYHHPTLRNAWKVVGAAVRLAVELGLHRDPPQGEINFMELDNMRRTFWVAYAMDRNLSVTLSLPCSLSDGAITAEFPSEAKDEHITPAATGHFLDHHLSTTKQITLHLLRYRQIQSETRRALHEEPFLRTDVHSLEGWQRQMHERIEAWYKATPHNSRFSAEEADVIETIEVTYNTALFHLYCPTPNIPSPSSPQLVVMAQATTKMIHLYRRFFCQNKLTIYWQAVQNVSSAGFGILFAYVNCPEVRMSISLHSLESLVHMCSSVLWGMVEKLPSARGKRDAFDTASSQVLADLNNGMATVEHDLAALVQTPQSWTNGVPNTIHSAYATAPDDTQMRNTSFDHLASMDAAGVDVTESDRMVGDVSFCITDADILTWMTAPATDAPNTLPISWI